MGNKKKFLFSLFEKLHEVAFIISKRQEQENLTQYLDRNVSQHVKIWYDIIIVLFFFLLPNLFFFVNVFWRAVEKKIKNRSIIHSSSWHIHITFSFTSISNYNFFWLCSFYMRWSVGFCSYDISETFLWILLIYVQIWGTDNSGQNLEKWNAKNWKKFLEFLGWFRFTSVCNFYFTITACDLFFVIPSRRFCDNFALKYYCLNHQQLFFG